MKKVVLYIGKFLIAAVISLMILSLLSTFYFNPPIAAVQSDGSTNYKYIPNLKWSYMLEGFGGGKTDAAGYNNAYYEDVSDPDIVFAGSSHIEALEVAEDENCVYLLNEMLDRDESKENDFKCLNIGISGHFFETTVSNYPYIAAKYSGAEYVVIEVFNAQYSAEMLDRMIAEEFHAPMEEKGALHSLLQRIPFVRLMYKKLNETLAAKNAAPSAGGDAITDQEAELRVYTEKMNVILGKIAETSEKNAIIPVILMHERFWPDGEGNITLETDGAYKSAFKACCAANGIKVIDVSSAMVSEYRETFAYSYGFSNSAPGEGHLNEVGHRIIAEAVYRCINEMEGIQ